LATDRTCDLAACCNTAVNQFVLDPGLEE